MSDLMDKIGALLLKAERSDNEHEQDAFMKKAQQLATLASIDLESARLRQETKEKRETPEARHVKLFEWGDKSQTKSYFIELFMTIGRANDCRFLISHYNDYVVAHGFPSDIDVTEALYQSLSLQMVAAAEQYLKRKEYREEWVHYESHDGYWGPTVERKRMDGRTARRNFYDGFRQRIGERLEEAKREAIAEAEPVQVSDEQTESAALVLKRRTDEVNDFYQSKIGKRTRSWKGGSNTKFSQSANAAGSSAGSKARMGGGASISGKRGMINA
jgi:hypothetical protein